MSQSQKISDEELYENFTKTAANIILYFDGDEKQQMLDDFKETVKSYCENDSKLESAREIKERVLGVRDNNDYNNEQVEEIVKEYKNAIAEINPDVSKCQEYRYFLDDINFLSEHAGNEEVSAGDSNEGSDEDFELTANVNVVDPISKKRIENPVKNMICGHVYDKESITELLKLNKKTRCPTIGCQSTEFISLDNLRNHVAMKMYLEKKYPK